MILLLVISATWFTIGDFFDPSKIDYCKMKCNNGEVSSGCADVKCYKHDEKNELGLDEIVKFRKLTLKVHNDIRNKFAKGLDPNKYPKAANMHVINYDLELEHILRCYILGDFVTAHDKCRLTSYCKNRFGAGQNMYGSVMDTGTLQQVEDGIIGWYDEIDLIPEDERKDLVKKYHSIQKYKAGHFTQFVWGAVTRMGCVRGWYPTNTVMHYKYVFGCNYAATNDLCSGNFIGKPMYAIGEPCSQCGNEKCNNEIGGKYDALCGKTLPVPTDPPTVLKPKGQNANNNNNKNKTNKNNDDDEYEYDYDDHGNKTKKKKKKGKGSINMSNRFLILSSAVVLLTNIS